MINMEPNRVRPALPVQAMQTFSVTVPPSGWRLVDCATYGCDQYVNGWVSRIDESTELGAYQARYIRRESGRGFTEERDESGVTVFRFPPGQRPFDDERRTHSTHRIRLDTPELYVVRDGDWRGNPTGRQSTIPSAQDFVDDMGEQLERLADAQKRG